FIAQGPNVFTTFALLFAVAMGVNRTLALVSATVSVESVPPALMATAAGTVMGLGETFGGGVAPVVDGNLASAYGIQPPPNLALVQATVAVESVAPALMATAAGTVMGLGEICGGGVAPVVAGNLASAYGIQTPLYLAMGGILVALVMVLFLQETAPSKLLSKTHSNANPDLTEEPVGNETHA